MPWVPVAAGVASILGTGAGLISSLTKKQPNQTSGGILTSPTASVNLDPFPGSRSTSQLAPLQMPSFDIGNFGKQQPSLNTGMGNFNSDLLKTLGNIGGGYG